MAPAAGLPPASLVSFWRSPDLTAKDQFACSGVFVADRTILTVAHAFPHGRTLWARPAVDGSQAYPVVGVPVRHPSLDAALVGIEFMPNLGVTAPLDISGRIGSGTELFSLNGFFGGRRETGFQVQWLSFETADRLHLLDVKQPPGHSGSGLERDGRLWGITVSHYTDANTHRGCAVSIGQLWQGWLEQHLRPRDHLAPAMPRHDLDGRARAIRVAVADNQLEFGRKQLLDLVGDFEPGELLDQASVISMSVRGLEGLNPNLSSTRKERERLAGLMLALTNRVVARKQAELRHE